MNNISLTALRTGASAAITALTILAAYHPSQIWINAAISAAATLGIHAIPAISQGAKTMTDGLTLMGLRAPVTDPAPAAVFQPPVTNPAVTETPAPVAQVLPDPVKAAAPVSADQLRQLAAYLESLDV
jgi:hypothetical protein